MAIKNLTSLFPLIYLSKHISLYALGWLQWILDIIWPLNQHFNLKNQRNWIKQVGMLKFLSGINCSLMHWSKKLTLVFDDLGIFLWSRIMNLIFPLLCVISRNYWKQFLKFMFSKKATKNDEIFSVDLTLCSKCQIDGEDFVSLRGLLRKYEP